MANDIKFKYQLMKINYDIFCKTQENNSDATYNTKIKYIVIVNVT